MLVYMYLVAAAFTRTKPTAQPCLSFPSLKSPNPSCNPTVMCHKKYLICLETKGGRNPSTYQIKRLLLQQLALAISTAILGGPHKALSTTYLHEKLRICFRHLSVIWKHGLPRSQCCCALKSRVSFKVFGWSSALTEPHLSPHGLAAPMWLQRQPSSCSLVDCSNSFLPKIISL